MADEQIILRVAPDGSVHAETRGMTGPRCLDSIEVLENLLDARTVTSAFTSDYHRRTTQDSGFLETEVDDEQHQR